MTKTLKAAMPPEYTLDIMISSPLWRALDFDIEAQMDAAVPVTMELADFPDFLQDKTLELSIVLSDDASVQNLNKEFRGKDKPTNVLSFANIDLQDEDGDSALTTLPSLPLGDVIIACETVQREAAEQNKSLSDHFTHLLIHGMLHLLGYDHTDEENAQEMESLETDILYELGIKNPYIEK